jgi:energy-coupling factor transporter ATP-binding protein EcfA2
MVARYSEDPGSHGLAVKISRIRIERFRAFTDQEFDLSPYACFVGANGAGKSTVLAALNVFFREQAAPGLDALKLNAEDFHEGDTGQPIRITLHFTDLTDAAIQALSGYVRQGELVVTAEGVFDPDAGFATVRYFGQRLGMDAFRQYFGDEEGGKPAAEMATQYATLRTIFPDLPAAATKAARHEALRAYESARPQECILIRSQDEFYGANSTGKLAAYLQWVYIPAVKDVGAEGFESKTSALGKLIRRTVRIHTDIDERLAELEADTVAQYQGLLDANRVGLQEIATSLQNRLVQWAHPGVRLDLGWLRDARGSVSLQAPVAGIKAGEGPFLASLSHMGHGLQRSYLLAILQELAAAEAPDAPTLVLGCEEPELYQHPPQARYLAQVFQDLASGNNQVIVTTHSPLFVAGRAFENVRLVRRDPGGRAPVVTSLTFAELCERIRLAGGDDPGRPIAGLVAKIHQALQPGIAEMLFTQVPVLVEGLEDVAYLTTQLHLAGRWDDFRRLGCQFIPTNGKDKLIQPLAIAKLLQLPAFLIFDADGHDENETRRPKHEADNRALMSLAGIPHGPFPDAVLHGSDYTIWPKTISHVVDEELGADLDVHKNAVRAYYAHEGGLEKNALFIADWMNGAYEAGLRSRALHDLIERILIHAEGAGRLRPEAAR